MSINKIMGNTLNGILLSTKEEQNNIIYKKMEGPGEHYVKQDQPITKREGTYVFINMCNLGSSGDTQGTLVDNGEPSAGQGKWYKGRGRARKKRISGITIINNVYM